MLADSGEDAIAFSDGSDYAANVELAAAPPSPARVRRAAEAMRKVETPTQKTCEDVAELLGIPLARTAKSIAVMTEAGFVLALVRGDHAVNEIKLAKVPGLAGYRMADEAEILEYLGSEPGFLGPIGARKTIRIVADREVAALADFVVGANENGFHIAGVNWGRDLPEPDIVADIRNIVAGDDAPDGKGKLAIVRGIEVGHVFQLGRKLRRGDGLQRARRNRQGGRAGDGLLRHRRVAHRRRGDRAEPRRRRHPVARADGAVARGGVHDQSEERSGRGRGRVGALRRTERRRHRQRARRSRPARRARCSPTSS